MQKRSSIVGGIIMIVLGILFLLLNMFPTVAERLEISRQWPTLIIAVGLFFLFSALLTTSELAIPGSIITGVGGILYYQNSTGDWASWAYLWTLIPGFVGVGLIIVSLLKKNRASRRRAGGQLLLISFVLFIIFALFFNGSTSLGQYWPMLLILAGIWLIFRKRTPNFT